MAFTAPLWLLLFIPLAWFSYWGLQKMQGLSRVQRWTALSLRLAICLLVVSALAGPELRLASSQLAVAFVADLSDSVPTKDQQKAKAFLDEGMRKLGGGDLGSVIIAGAQPMMETSAGPSRPVPVLQSKVDPKGSNLASAVRLGIASLPGGANRRVVLLTDGNETDGDLAQAAEAAAAEQIVLDVLPLGTGRERPEAYVAELTSGSDVRVGAKALIKARIVADRGMAAEITLERDGVVRTKRAVQLSEGENQIVFEEPVEKIGTSRYRATLEAPDDGDTRNNIGLTVVSAKGPSRTLLIEDSASPSPLFHALKSRGLNVVRVTPGSAPYRLADFAQYDAILLNDVNATHFSEGQMKAVQSAVRDSGAGFAMVGGEDSFLPGGWYMTPIADVLPVDLNIRKRKDLPSTSILIMVDCSGSMSAFEDGLPKLELAKKAAEVTANLLGPMDRLAVAGSSDGIEFVVPMGPLVKEQATSGIRKLAVTGGGIYIGPSVTKANEVLSKEPSKVRHLILLADGADSTDWRDSLFLAGTMRKAGITTSVIAFGEGQYLPDLKRLAAIGGGRYYLATKARQLPAIFSQDAAVVARSAIEEGAFFPKQTGSDDAIRGLEELPALLAYCLTDSRPMARTILRTHKDDPLLAKWQYGLGTGVAFTSDAEPRWAKQWVGWEGYDVFWSQLTRGMARRATQTRSEMTAEQRSGEVIVTVRTEEGKPPTSLRAVSPSGVSTSVSLEPKAPGVFEARFKGSELGSTIISLVEESPTGALVQVESVSRAYPAEYQSASANLALLEQAASATGGKLIKTPEEAVRSPRKTVVTPLEVWFWCLLAACLLFPLDVASRRLTLKSFSWKRKPVPIKAQEPPIHRLKAAKERVKQAERAEPRRLMPEEKQQEAPQPAKSESQPSSASQRLLEMKRKRADGAGEKKPPEQ